MDEKGMSFTSDCHCLFGCHCETSLLVIVGRYSFDRRRETGGVFFMEGTFLVDRRVL